jgi:metallo-beta-lactamase family protein
LRFIHFKQKFKSGRFISAEADRFSMRLEFRGGAGGVTGSHLILDIYSTRIGVDAGLFQGRDADQNLPEFKHDPQSLKALLLTHAHIDHSGRIPLLVKNGFEGPIYCTSATADLCEIMLKDSAYLMQEAADYEKRHQDRVRGPFKPPLYTMDDVIHALSHFEPVDYDSEFNVSGLTVNFRDAGHILGSSLIELTIGNRKLVFSGDLGRPGAPFLRDPVKVEKADWLVLESTYGNRNHEDNADRGKRLLQIVLETVEQGGNVVIPAFAVGRTQEILFDLNPYAETGKLKGIKCFVDSPMAISAVEIYRRHPECFDSETLAMISRGDNPLEFPGIKYARSRDESKAINDLKEPHIIVSASGMCTGGRVLHHLVQNLERPESTILFVGYQAEGTLGRKLLDGARNVRVMNKELDVRARIELLDSFSAHSSRSETMQWLSAFREFPSTVFLNHGEPHAAQFLARLVKKKFGTKVVIPKVGESHRLS